MKHATATTIFTVLENGNDKQKEQKYKRKLKKDGTPKWSGGDRKSGVSSTVYPIKDPEKFTAFYNYWLQQMQKTYTPYKKYICARNNLLIVVGCNSAYRISDIVTLQWKDILDTDTIIRKEQKTGKYRGVFFNPMVQEATDRFLETMNQTRETIDKESYVFTTCKSKDGHMTPANVLAFIKQMAKDIGIKENIGTHTLRKNFVYWTLISHKDDVNILYRVMELMNHSSPRMTFAYATITQEESKTLFLEVGETYKAILSGVYDGIRKNVVSISYNCMMEMMEFSYQTALEDANADNTVHADNMKTIEEMLRSYLV